ncbi:MAG: magnesium/cobalt transporter CorA [Crocinitomicaceae bacterium]|nr:magnesium/cobalt transporter CorA [Crocinitomicaceae bacterium]
MNRIRKGKSRTIKSGAIPGTLMHIGPETDASVIIDMIDFGPDQITEKQIDEEHDLKGYLETGSVSWINLTGIHNANRLRNVGDLFELDDLLLEDIMNTDHRPKLEEFPKHSFLVLKMLSINESGHVESEQVCLVLGSNYVLSFQERTGDVFEPIRERIRKDLGRVRKLKADYLAFLLIDIIIDNYFFVIEELGDKLDLLEQRVLENPEEDILQELQSYKAQLITVRKAVFPLREMLSSILKEDCDNINKVSLKYFRDSYDHCMDVIDSVEAFTDLSNSVRDLYISAISNKMNQIMKVLTIMASIFIPLTFIAGLYGMNFNYIPEIHELKYGYFIILGVMLVVTIIMIRFFKRKKWF